MFLPGKKAATVATVLLLLVSAHAEIQKLDKPAYPLGGIVRSPANLSDNDLKVLADNFKILQSGFSKEHADKLHKLNPDLKLLQYTNTTYTRYAKEVEIVEKNYRKGLAMTPAANLVSDISADATEFTLTEPKGRVKKEKPIPVLASTIEGNYSSTDPKKPSNQYFVFWIQVGDEFMRVNAYDAKTKVVKVTRGFDGTTPAAHKADSVVLSPIYLGFQRPGREKYPGFHPNGPGDRLRYVLDAQKRIPDPMLGDIIVEMLKEGKDGAWLDIIGSGFFNMSDALGNQTSVWNHETQKLITSDQWRKAKELKVNAIQNYVKERTGKEPFLVGNTMKIANYEEGKGGEKFYLMSTPHKPKPLDGMILEAWCGHSDHPVSGKEWTQHVIMMMKIAQERLSAFARTSMTPVEGEMRRKLEEFGYGNYLLCVEKNPTTLFVCEAAYLIPDPENPKRTKPVAKLHPQYFWPVGDPVETHKPQDLEKYRIPGKNSYQRKFTNGLVLVNPSPEATDEITLEVEMIDPETGKEIKTVVLPSKTRKILLKK